MKKRILCLVLTLVLLFAAAPFASAASGTCGRDVRWSFDSETGELTVSGSGEMYDYADMVSAPWSDYTADIQAITIESGVTYIGAGAFSKCSAATALTMADTVTSIGGWAFHFCKSLEKLDLSDSLEVIGNYAFCLCSAAKSVTLPAGLKTIGNDAFTYCSSLSAVSIPSTVAYIGGWAFSSCSALQSVRVPSGVESIGNGTFANCSSLAAVTLPASVTAVGSSAFCGCPALKDVYYTGSADAWSRVAVGDDNSGLTAASLHCSASEPDPQPKPDPQPDPDPVLTEPFDDVADADWFSGAVKYVYHNSIMDGVSDTVFAPGTAATRAMIVTILWRLQGSPAASGGAAFSDVETDAWYGAPVAWAAANGIVDGYGDGTFHPTASVTREQMAAMLYRYSVHTGRDVSAAGDLSAFTDGADVSAYAAAAMRWAVGAGLINGTGDSLLEPSGTAVRSQVAALFMRYCTAAVG